MDNLSKLRSRKAVLKAQIEQEHNELKKTLYEIREELEPARLLKKAVSGAIGFSEKKTGTEVSSLLTRLPAPLSFIIDLLVRDPKWALGLKLLAPVAIRYWPEFDKAKKTAGAEKPPKEASKPLNTKIYGRLRKGISNLRIRLHKSPKAVELPTENTEN